MKIVKCNKNVLINTDFKYLLCYSDKVTSINLHTIAIEFHQNDPYYPVPILEFNISYIGFIENKLLPQIKYFVYSRNS